MADDKLPFFAFYPDDYLSSPGVTTCDLKDDGIYIRLLAFTWKHPGCQLPDDMAYIRKLCKGARAARVQGVLGRHFYKVEIVTTKFCWRNARLYHEFILAIKRSEHGKVGAKSRWNKEKHDARAMPGQCPDDGSHSHSHNHKVLEAAADCAEGAAQQPAAPENHKKKRKPKLNDTEWMAMVKASPAYAGIDIDRIHSKFVLWCSNKSKNPSRARFLNWLNREEQPMKTAGALTPTSEGDEMRKRTARQELESALRNERNKRMPDLSTDAKKLFYSLGTRWDILQHKVVTGQNVFEDPAAPAPESVKKEEPKKQDDYKSMAAGDREEEDHGG